MDNNTGQMAPRYELENRFNTFSSDIYTGKYTLIQFWDSNDASSRIANKQLAKLSQNHRDKLNYAGVYTGSDETLFASALKADKCDQSTQFNLSNSEVYNRLYADFSLASGNHCFLISPSGRIVAVNPSSSEIEHLINS